MSGTGVASTVRRIGGQLRIRHRVCPHRLTSAFAKQILFHRIDGIDITNSHHDDVSWKRDLADYYRYGYRHPSLLKRETAR